LKRHPDKSGGSTEAFQKLSAAYEHLEKDDYSEKRPTQPSAPARKRKAAAAWPEPESPDEEKEKSSSSDDYSHEDENYRSYYDFFGTWGGFHREDFDEEDEATFRFWRRSEKQRRRDAAKKRREDIKKGYDYRDHRARGDGKSCIFCGVNEGITKEDALSSGLNWVEYNRHPENSAPVGYVSVHISLS